MAVGEMLEDDCRAEFVVGELHRPQHAAVFQGLQQAEFPLGGPLDHRPLFLVGLGLNQVDADAAEGVLRARRACRGNPGSRGLRR